MRQQAHSPPLHCNTQAARRNDSTPLQVKAKVIRKYVDKMITLAKDGSLHARRQAMGFIYDKELVANLFDAAAERYGERNGGYTRIKPDPKVRRGLGGGGARARCCCLG